MELMFSWWAIAALLLLLDNRDEPATVAPLSACSVLGAEEEMAIYLDEAEDRLGLLASVGMQDRTAYEAWSGQLMPPFEIEVEDLEGQPPDLRERLVRLIRDGQRAGIHVRLVNTRGERG